MSLWPDHWPYGGALSFGLLKGLGWACGEAGAAGASLRVEVAPAPVPEELIPLPSPLSYGLNLWVLLQDSGPEVFAVLEHREDSLCGPQPSPPPSSSASAVFGLVPGASWSLSTPGATSGGGFHGRVGTLQQCRVTGGSQHCTVGSSRPWGGPMLPRVPAQAGAGAVQGAGAGAVQGAGAEGGAQLHGVGERAQLLGR